MNLFTFYQKFNTEEKCVDYLKNIRWSDGVVKCPKCDHTKIYTVYNGKRYKCANNKCYHKFSVKSGTIFDNSNIPLWQSFYLMFGSCMNKKNTSSVQEALNLGMTQKTVWYIMMRVRMLCYQDDTLVLSGKVEIDETYLAAGKWHRRQQKASGRKIPVLGLIERGTGRAVIKVIPARNKKLVQKILLKYIETDSTIFTDSAGCYSDCDIYFNHNVINHSEGIYVRGDTHTNTVENMWHHLKTAITKTHAGISLHHLQRYCDEFAYRWNNKHLSPLEKFEDLMRRACDINPLVQNKILLGAYREKKKVTEKDHEKIVQLQQHSSKNITKKSDVCGMK